MEILRKLFFCLTFVLCFSTFILDPTNVFASYQAGDQGTGVVELQEQLISLGYDITIADGVFGEETVQAVQAYQQSVGLTADGVVGSATFNSLFSRGDGVSRAGNSSIIRNIIKAAFQYIGVPYVFGGTDPWGFDCSGFTQYVFAEAGVYLPRMADSQFYAGMQIASKNLQIGDLVFFETYEPGPSHCGIYLGNGEFIHAGSSTGVTVSNVFGSYWGERYIGACRISM